MVTCSAKTWVVSWEQTDFNVQIGHLEPDLRAAIFGPCEIVERDNADMLDVLVLTGVFSSRGQARKNWRRTFEIQAGSSLHVIGKKKLRVFIHRAMEETNG